MSTQRINIGSMYSEHAVPPGAQVRELKTCEICGRSFARKFAATEIYATYVACFTVMLSKPPLEVTVTLRKDRGERFCGACKSRQLMPDVEAQIKYLIQLPGTTQQMKHAPHEPKYDRSLLPREGRHDGPRPRRNYCPPLLSPAELRVAELVATRHEGYIRLSAELGLGIGYFKYVAAEVYRKLNVRGREQLMSLWAQDYSALECWRYPKGAPMQVDPTWHQGDIVAVLTLLVLAGGYILNRGTDNRERQKARDLQTERHAQNTEKLDHLGKFRMNQEQLNRQRDEQIALLRDMASTSAAALKGFDRRLELVENETRDNRRPRGNND